MWCFFFFFSFRNLTAECKAFQWLQFFVQTRNANTKQFIMSYYHIKLQTSNEFDCWCVNFGTHTAVFFHYLGNSPSNWSLLIRERTDIFNSSDLFCLVRFGLVLLTCICGNNGKVIQIYFDTDISLLSTIFSICVGITWNVSSVCLLLFFFLSFSVKPIRNEAICFSDFIKSINASIS